MFLPRIRGSHTVPLPHCVLVLARLVPLVLMILMGKTVRVIFERVLAADFVIVDRLFFFIVFFFVFFLFLKVRVRH